MILKLSLAEPRPHGEVLGDIAHVVVQWSSGFARLDFVVVVTHGPAIAIRDGADEIIVLDVI